MTAKATDTALPCFIISWCGEDMPCILSTGTWGHGSVVDEMSIFQILNVCWRPTFPGELRVLQKERVFDQTSGSEFPSEFEVSVHTYPQPFYTPTRLPLILRVLLSFSLWALQG